ncbi:hypothetical protein BJX99DRAFT_222709 [Aspergillus californicus]
MTSHPDGKLYPLIKDSLESCNSRTYEGAGCRRKRSPHSYLLRSSPNHQGRNILGLEPHECVADSNQSECGLFRRVWWLDSERTGASA